MKLFLRSILVLVFASFSPLASAQIITWSNTGSDNSFDDASNWVNVTGVGTVPGSTNDVGIFPGFTTSQATGGGIIVQQNGTSNITINTVNNHTIDSIFFSGQFFASTATNTTVALNFNSGSTLTIDPSLISNQALEVSGGTALTFTGNITSSGNFTIGESVSTLQPGLYSGSGSLTLGAGTVNLDAAGGTTLTVGQGGQTGTVTQNTGSTVVTGNILQVETGNYNVNGGAELDLGAQGAPASPDYQMTVGTTSGDTAAVTIAGGTMSAINPDSFLNIGDGGTGSVTENNVASTVTFAGDGSGIFIGESGAIGTYNLSAGALSIGANNVDADELSVGTDSGSTGNFTQTGGTVIVGANSTAVVGDSGTGNYSISGPNTVTADFRDGLTIGNNSTSVGTFTQSGGLVTVEGPMIVGRAGSGTYTMTGGELDANGTLSIGSGGGTGIFNYGGTGVLVISNGITIGATGTFNQNASIALDNPVTQAVSIASGGVYNLNSGTLTTGGNSIFTGAGNFNFAGGTVAVTTPWTDPFDGTVSGTSTINTTTGGATLSGNLSSPVLGPSGTLDIIGGNTVHLTGANSGSWGATITGNSTLTAASAASLSNNGSFQIGSGSTLNVLSTGPGPDTFAGSISNISDPADPAGTAHFNTGNNKLVLSGPVNLDTTTATTIGTGGGLEVDTGTISNINGSTGNAGDTFDVGNGTSTGTVKLLGNNLLPTVTVNDHSTLLAGNITGNVTNSGTLVTLGSTTTPSPLLINGSLTSTGTLLFHSNALAVDSIGTTVDPLTTATLSGIVRVVGSGTHTNVPIVITSGGVTATIGTAPGDLTTAGATALFSYTISNNGTEILLNTVQSTLGSFARTPNESAVAGVLDPIIAAGSVSPGFNRVLTGLNNLAGSSLPYAIESLTPDTLQYSRIIAFEGSTFLVQRMNGVDSDLRAGYGGLDTNAISLAAPGFNSSMGRSLNSLLASDSPAYHAAAPNGVNYYPSGTGATMSTMDPSAIAAPESSPMPNWQPSSQVISDSPSLNMSKQHPNGPDSPAFSEFISGDFVLADMNTDRSIQNAPTDKASYKAEDATAGISYRITSNFSAGVLFDYDHTDAKTDSHGSQIEVNTYQPGLFATYFSHGFYANALFTFGYNEYDNTRQIQFLGDSAHSTPSGDQYVGDLDFGYDFHPNRDWVVGPTLGVTYTQLNVDSFTETGAPGANLAVDSQQAESVRSRLGGHVIFQADTGSILFQPNISAVWQHEYLNDASAITSSFSDFNSGSFNTETVAPSRDSALLTIGLTATLNTSLSLYLNYMADAGADNFFAQSVMGGFKARF